MNYKFLSLTILLFSVLSFTTFAQTQDSTFASISGTDTLLVMDTVIDEVLEIDENPNIIFSDQMDSLVQSWDIQNKFQFDTSEVRLNDYPKNLPDSIYIQRLIDIEQVVDLSYNKTVGNYIKMYTERRRDQVEVMLGLSAYYFPIFEETPG